MQKKHLLVIATILFGLANFSYCQHENASHLEATYKAPENIAFILLKLVNNEIKIEKYNNKEFTLATNVIEKQKSSDHCIMTINMKERSLSPHTICWNEEKAGKIDIITGRTQNLIYSINLENLFKDVDNEVMAICFDCVVERRKDKETKEWKSLISVVLPVKLDDTRIEFIFDEKIKAACGFFMGNEDFENLIAISGDLLKKEALESGLLYLSTPTIEQEIKDPITEEKPTVEVLEPKDDIIEPVISPVVEDIPDEPTDQTTEENEEKEVIEAEPTTSSTPEPIAEPSPEVELIVEHTPEAIEETPQEQAPVIIEQISPNEEKEEQPQTTFSYVLSKIKDGAIFLREMFSNFFEAIFKK